MSTTSNPYVRNAARAVDLPVPDIPVTRTLRMLNRLECAALGSRDIPERWPRAVSYPSGVVAGRQYRLALYDGNGHVIEGAQYMHVSEETPLALDTARVHLQHPGRPVRPSKKCTGGGSFRR